MNPRDNRHGSCSPGPNGTQPTGDVHNSAPFCSLVGSVRTGGMYRLLLSMLFTALALAGCARTTPLAKPVTVIKNQAPPPQWVFKTGLSAQELCGIGVAGPGYPGSPYPKELSRERSIHNLSGALATEISEAIIDHTRHNITTIEMARVLHVDEDLLARVSHLAKTTYWLDSAGIGPFMQPGFTYAHSCIDTPTAIRGLSLPESSIPNASASQTTDPHQPPTWLHKTGRQPDDRLCAVGYSLPTFYPDKTFTNVVEEIRIQLSKVIQTLVSSYHEDATNRYGSLIEAITVASTDAISRGAVVSHYWYDKAGVGPFGTKGSTYGWGCIYPLDVVTQAVQTVQKSLPEEEKPALEEVRKRANRAFDELESEIEKQEPIKHSPKT